MSIEEITPISIDDGMIMKTILVEGHGKCPVAGSDVSLRHSQTGGPNDRHVPCEVLDSSQPLLRDVQTKASTQQKQAVLHITINYYYSSQRSVSHVPTKTLFTFTHSHSHSLFRSSQFVATVVAATFNKGLQLNKTNYRWTSY
jgi:hypothetical protein